MKIDRSSRLSSLTPWLILALLTVSAGVLETSQTQGMLPSLVPTVAAQEKVDAKRPAIEEKTLTGVKKDVVATTVTSAKGTKPRTLVGGTFTEYSVAGGGPQLMAVAPDGSIFYCLGKTNKIGQIANPASASEKLSVREFSIPTPNSFPEGIVVAADGMVWFTEQRAGNIARLDPKDGVISEYPIPTPNSGPVGITVGPDNNIWFTEAYSNKIGMLDPNNPQTRREFRIPTLVSAPIYITSGPDGGRWYVGSRSHKLGRIDPRSFEFVEYPTLTRPAGPTSVITGPDGALWVSELAVDKIARFDVAARKFTEEIPVDSKKNGARSGPGMLVNGPDGNIWFTEMLGNQIARLNPKTKEIYEFEAPSVTALALVDSGPEACAEDVYTESYMLLKPGETQKPSRGPGGS